MPSVSIRRVSELVEDVDTGKLILAPPYQRRLVWTNAAKEYFLDTVIKGLPFPEIFIRGKTDVKTRRRTIELVDGQQRISTLRQYMQGSPDLELERIPPFEQLENQSSFLDYEVAVRDLGPVNEDEIREIFARINSTDFALKAMERRNAKYSGKYISFCEQLSKDNFFSKHKIFTTADWRRMRDVDFCVILVTTLLFTYYDRDSLNEEYLKRYNDEFPEQHQLLASIQGIFEFIDLCKFDPRCRVWRKTDLLTLIVEIQTMFRNGVQLSADKAGKVLSEFYDLVDVASSASKDAEENRTPTPEAFRYLKAATRASNDKYARFDRAQIIAGILESTSRSKPVKATSKKLSK